MTWIKTVAPEAADGELAKVYTRLLGPSGHVDNIMTAHSLRPHTMKGHMTLYKYVLHHPRNTIEKWFLECVGVYTSLLNKCDYCVEHHAAGMARLVDDSSQSDVIMGALRSESWATAFDKKQAAALIYARQLTTAPDSVSKDDIVRMQDVGWSDGEILELNQVVAYFAYANRTVLGLGIDTDGDVLGTSPGGDDDPENWAHR